MIHRILICLILSLLIPSCAEKSVVRHFSPDELNCDNEGHPRDSSSVYFPAEFFKDTVNALFDGTNLVRLDEFENRDELVKLFDLDVNQIRDTFEIDDYTFFREFYSYTLFKMDEPILYDHYLNKEIYRMIAFRSKSPTTLIRIEKNKKTITGFIKKLNKGIRYPFIIYDGNLDNLPYIPPDVASYDNNIGKMKIHDMKRYTELLAEKKFHDSIAKIENAIDYKLIKNMTFKISKKTWDSLQVLIDSAAFWKSRPELSLNIPQIDGSTWILEAQTENGYQIRAVTSPNFDNSPYPSPNDKQNHYVKLFRFLMKTAHLSIEPLY